MQQEELKAIVLEEARYFVEQKSTVRETAKQFGSAKSTIYNHLTYLLSSYDPFLAEEVKEILNFNRIERAFRGGASTKKKYLLLKNKSEEDA